MIQDDDSVLNKLPALTAGFWLLKIVSTTLGETGGDWLSMTMGLGYLSSTAIFFALFVLSLFAQLSVSRHIPLIYWTVIVATSTAGTTLSDYMDRTLHLGYALGSGILLSCLITILAVWKITLGNVNVNTIRSRRSEGFYWFTILVSNTLGTALGDFLADESGLGFFHSWLLISSALLTILLLYRFTKLNRVALFWLAFVLTRPFGATFGDTLTKTKEAGGLDLGTASASGILLAILALVIPAIYRRGADRNWNLIL